MILMKKIVFEKFPSKYAEDKIQEDILSQISIELRKYFVYFWFP